MEKKCIEHHLQGGPCSENRDTPVMAGSTSICTILGDELKLISAHKLNSGALWYN